MKKFLAMSVVCGLLFTSCASIFGGGGAKMIPVSVEGTMDYEITVNGVPQGQASMIKVEKDDVVSITADGYRTSVTHIQGKFNPTTLLNLISWGIIGFVVDGVTGAWTKVETPLISVKLKVDNRQ